MQSQSFDQVFELVAAIKAKAAERGSHLLVRDRMGVLRPFREMRVDNGRIRVIYTDAKSGELLETQAGSAGRWTCTTRGDGGVVAGYDIDGNPVAFVIG